MHAEKKILETISIYVFYLIIPALNQTSTSKILLWSHLTPSRRYIHPELKDKRPIACCTEQAGWFLCFPLWQSALQARLLLLLIHFTRNSISDCPHTKMILVTSKANIKDEQVFIMLLNELSSKLLALPGARSTFLSHPDNQDISSFYNLFPTAWDISNSTETLCTSFGSSGPGTRRLWQSHPEIQATDPTGSRSYQDSSRVFRPGWLKAKNLNSAHKGQSMILASALVFYTRL